MANITQRKLRDGRTVFDLTWNTGRMVDGKPERRYETIDGPPVRTKTDAKNYWIAKLPEMRAAAKSTTAKTTLRDYLDVWLRDYGSQHLKPTTRDSYAACIEQHILRELGDTRLGELTPAIVSAWQAALLRKPSRRGGTIAPRTVAYARAVLRSALHEAVNQEIIESNPVDRVRAPRQDKHEAVAVTPEQAAALVAAVTPRMKPVVDFVWRSGLRLGESLGLKWEDVDLEARTITVRNNLVRAAGRTLTDNPGKQTFTQAPKTERGARTFALMPNAVTLLRSHRARQAEERLKAGERWQDTGFVFTTKDGRHLSRNHVEHAFHDAREKAGLPRAVTFHSLRHGYATIAKRAGVDLVEVSKALGHSTPAFTATVYQHVTPESQHEAADQMEEWLNRRSGKV